MKGKILVPLCLLVVSILVFSGCAPPTPAPVSPAASPTEVVSAPAEVRAALNAALAYLAETYPDLASAAGRDWAARFVESEGQVGAGGYEFSSGDWLATITYPVVRPDLVVYSVALTNNRTGFRWSGKVDAQAQVEEHVPVAEAAPAEVRAALNAALAYLAETYPDLALAEGMDWAARFVESEGQVGAGGYEFSSGDWLATITYPVVRPDLVVYDVTIVDAATSFWWWGEVDAAGEITVEGLPLTEQSVVAWYGYVVSTPPDAQFDDYLALVPEDAGAVGLEGATLDVEAQIEALRDEQQPGKYAHFWGTLTCEVLDYGGCQLLVDRLRVDGPGEFFPPDVVEGWEGIVVSGPLGPRSGGDDYLQMMGEFPVQYGLDAGADGPLAVQLDSLRDTGIIVQVWGEVAAGVPDWNGTQIRVIRIETGR